MTILEQQVKEEQFKLSEETAKLMAFTDIITDYKFQISDLPLFIKVLLSMHEKPVVATGEEIKTIEA